MEDEPARRSVLEESLGACDAEELLVLLKAESERYWHVDPHISLRAAETLIDAARLAGQPYHEALGLMAKGDALRFLGRYPESLPFFERAAEAFLVQGHEVGWARTRIGWLHTMHLLGRGEEALAVAERAREILIRYEEWLRAGGLDLNTAVVCKELGRYAQALDLYDRARMAFESLGASVETHAAYAKASKAVLLTLLGDSRAALALYDEVREVWARRGEDASVIRQDHNIAWIYAGQGHYTRALRLLSDVFAAHEKAGLAVEAAWAALNMVECYLGLNRYADALELAQETVERFERCGT
ncbi:MAG: tetratricopeptide repeat protein, partial [Chloroflexota bacterium]